MDKTVEKKEYIRPRNVNLAFRVTEEERKMIERRMAQAGMQNMRAFIVKMAGEGEINRIDLSSVREMVRLLSNATNNINQIAKRANQTHSVYASDLNEVRRHYEEIWGQAKAILQELAKLSGC